MPKRGRRAGGGKPCNDLSQNAPLKEAELGVGGEEGGGGGGGTGAVVRVVVVVVVVSLELRCRESLTVSIRSIGFLKVILSVIVVFGCCFISTRH